MKNLIRRASEGLFRAYRASEIKLHPLRSILWECTLRCNLNCGHCASACLPSDSRPDADEKLLYRALESISNAYDPSGVMVGITGGEPTVRLDLPQIVLNIHSLGFPVGIVTNGFALSPQLFIGLINNGLRSLTVSLDGLEDEHNRLRGNSRSFANALVAIRNAARFIKQTEGGNGFGFDVVTCVHSGNIGQLPELKRILEDAGVEHWRLFSIFPSGRAGDGRFGLSTGQYCQMLDFISGARREKAMDVSYSCEGWLGEYERKARGSYYFCRAGITNAGIFSDGSVGGCISIRSRDFIAGNLNERDFLEIWNSGFDLYRDRSWTRKGMCAECREYPNCLGNGLHLHSSLDSGPARCSLADSRIPPN